MPLSEKNGVPGNYDLFTRAAFLVGSGPPGAI